MSMDINQKHKMMTEAPVERLILKLAVPTIISMLVTSLYNMADTFFVGRISTQATAAVGVSFSIMALIQAVGFFFGQGSGNFISRSLGAQNFEQTKKMAATGLVYAFMTGVVFMAVCIAFLEPICKLLCATPTIIDDTVAYIRIILIGAPFMMSSMVLNNQLRFQGSAVYSMVGLCCGAVINVALDPLLIFVFDMGVAGAAIATTTSQIISFIVLWIGTRQKSNVRIELKNFSLDPFYIKEIARCGTPSLCRQGLSSIATISINFIAGIYGDAAIAAMSVVQRIVMFIFSALIGFGQGFQPVCGFNYGAKKYKRVLKAFYFLVKVSAVVLSCAAVVGFIYAPQIVAFFRDDAEVIKIGALAFRANCISLPLLCITLNSSMILQNIGKAVPATILGSARGGWVFIPVLFGATAVFGLFGLQITQMVADIIATVIAVPFIISMIKELNNKQKEVAVKDA